MPAFLRFALLSLLLAVSAPGQELSVTVQAKVVGVHDGDTISVLTPPHIQFKVRLRYIDAPELKQPFGYRAKQALSDLVFGHEVQLHISGLDKYGRSIAEVYTEENVNTGLALVVARLAWPYYKYLADNAKGAGSYRGKATAEGASTEWEGETEY
jgi:endonuclease YncB( thermonuclease family)